MRSGRAPRPCLFFDQAPQKTQKGKKEEGRNDTHLSRTPHPQSLAHPVLVQVGALALPPTTTTSSLLPFLLPLRRRRGFPRPRRRCVRVIRGRKPKTQTETEAETETQSLRLCAQPARRSRAQDTLHVAGSMSVYRLHARRRGNRRRRRCETSAAPRTGARGGVVVIPRTPRWMYRGRRSSRAVAETKRAPCALRHQYSIAVCLLCSCCATLQIFFFVSSRQ
jgi:hypothetical protein